MVRDAFRVALVIDRLGGLGYVHRPFCRKSGNNTVREDVVMLFGMLEAATRNGEPRSAPVTDRHGASYDQLYRSAARLVRLLARHLLTFCHRAETGVITINRYVGDGDSAGRRFPACV
jgi:hypothetical protein